jgi:hypothetical protein
MKRQSRIAVALLAGASLVIAACGGDDGGSTNEAPADSEAPSTEAPSTEAPVEEPTASDVGITETTISIGVAIADLEAVRAAGISIPETLTTEHLFDRWKVFIDKWNAEGGINGRTIELVQLVWDPLNQASFDTLCAAATVDNDLFMILNGTGLSGVARQCILDAGVPIYYGDTVSPVELESGLLMTASVPSDAAAEAGVAAWASTTTAAAGTTIGVLASNSPAIQAAGNAAAAALEAAGYVVEKVELNSLSGDNAAINAESGAAVATFQAAGVADVLVATPFTENTGFWAAAAEAELTFTLLDTSSSGCSPFGLSRVNAAAAGSLCATVFDHATNAAGEKAEDSAFEAECRAFFDESFSEYYGGNSMLGVPAGQKITDASGNELISDYTPLECSIANILKQALTLAGVNPTRASFMEATFNLGEVPLAQMSGGVGRLAPDKPYAATASHTVKITTADASVVPDANGLYTGCAAPVNCGVVQNDWVTFG